MNLDSCMSPRPARNQTTSPAVLYYRPAGASVWERHELPSRSMAEMTLAGWLRSWSGEGKIISAEERN